MFKAGDRSGASTRAGRHLRERGLLLINPSTPALPYRPGLGVRRRYTRRKWRPLAVRSKARSIPCMIRLHRGGHGNRPPDPPTTGRHRAPPRARGGKRPPRFGTSLRATRGHGKGGPRHPENRLPGGQPAGGSARHTRHPPGNHRARPQPALPLRPLHRALPRLAADSAWLPRATKGGRHGRFEPPTHFPGGFSHGPSL